VIVGAVPLFRTAYDGDAGWLLRQLVILMMLALMAVVARRRR